MYLRETSIQSNGLAIIIIEFIGSAFTRWSFRLPAGRILELGIFIKPISPFILLVRPTSCEFM